MPKAPRSNPIACTILAFSFFGRHWLAGFGAPRSFFLFFLATWSGLAASAVIGALG
jgi:hypothetical protein